MDFLINTFLLAGAVSLLFIVLGVFGGLIEHWVRVRRARRHLNFMRDKK